MIDIRLLFVVLVLALAGCGGKAYVHETLDSEKDDPDTNGGSYP